MLVRRGGAPAAAAAPGGQQQAAAAGGGGSAAAAASFHPDGSAQDPQALLRMLEAAPQQLANLPPALAEAVRAKNVEGMQVCAGAGVRVGGEGR